MQNSDLILAEEFCTHHNIAATFISALHQYNLIEITTIDNAVYIPYDQLQKVEQLTRMHFDLQINLEGIDAICHLLDRVRSLQSELANLKTRLKIYEESQPSSILDF